MSRYNDNFSSKKEQIGVDSFVDSINEEIRKENYERLWKKYGKVISTFTIALILGSSIYTYWKKQDIADKEAISDRFTAAQNELMSDRKNEAVTKFREIGKVSKKNYATLAKLEYAAILRDKGDKAALTQYKLIADDNKISKILRDLAYIYYVNSALDLMDEKELKNNLPLFIKILPEYIGKSWSLIAQETLAYCYIKLGNKQKAKTTLQSLATSENIPSGMLERARELVQYLDEKK